MRINFRRFAAIPAIVVGIGVGCASMPLASASPFFEDQDYSKSKTYQQGLREGKSDGVHHKDHSKKRHFNKDEDNKAYEAGYQKGHGN
jgi:hypothetical protein